MKLSPLLKKSLIKILICLIIIFILYFTIKIIYSSESFIPDSTENAIFIIDGDTFELSNGEIIRLLCVNTPEKSEDGYEEAKAFLSSSILGKNISIERQGIDKYNRTLAWVSAENNWNITLINKQIVDNELGILFEYNETDCSRMKT